MIVCLGTKINNNGNTIISMQHRLNIATRIFYSQIKQWQGRASLETKLKHWLYVSHPIVLFGSRNWHLNNHIVDELRRWELKHLRKAFKCRRKVMQPGLIENNVQYFTRTATMIYTKFRQTGAAMIHQKAAQGLFREAKREQSNTDQFGNILRGTMIARSQQWWEGIRDQPLNTRGL